MTKQSFEVVDLLVQENPKAITEKSNHGQLPLHLACSYRQSLEVIQLLVPHNPDTVKTKDMDGWTPCDLARWPVGEEGSDAGTVGWLEAFASAQINVEIVAKQPTALPRSRRGEGKSDVPTLPPTDVDMNVVRPTIAAANTLIKDRCSVQDILEGQYKKATTSLSHFESTRSKEIIGNGFFGTACKGTDMKLHSSFALKAIHTDLLT